MTDSSSSGSYRLFAAHILARSNHFECSASPGCPCSGWVSGAGWNSASGAGSLHAGAGSGSLGAGSGTLVTGAVQAGADSSAAGGAKIDSGIGGGVNANGSASGSGAGAGSTPYGSASGANVVAGGVHGSCLLYTSPSPRDGLLS